VYQKSEIHLVILFTAGTPTTKAVGCFCGTPTTKAVGSKLVTIHQPTALVVGDEKA
jgi:hypothetical protein